MLASFSVSLVATILAHFMNMRAPSLRKTRVLYSWRVCLRGRHAKLLWITTLVWTAGMGIIMAFIPAGNISSTDPVRITFGLSGAAGAFAGGYITNLLPRTYAITTGGIRASGFASHMYLWSIIAHHEIKNNVLALELVLRGYPITLYLPLGGHTKQVEKAISDAVAA